MKISFICAAGTLLTALISTSAWAQAPRGRVTLDQTSPVCNSESFRDDNDIDDDVVINQPCTLRAAVRDAAGRRISGVAVQLFQGDPDDVVVDDDDDDDTRVINQQALVVRSATGRTDRAGNATFSVPSPEGETCYQARTDRNASNRQVASLRSDVLCVSTDDTVAFNQQTGEEIVVAE